MDLMSTFMADFYVLWQSGGILMWPLLLLAVFIYLNIFELFSRFSQIELEGLFEPLKKEVLAGNPNTTSMRERVSMLKTEYLPYFRQRIHFITILVGVPPLLGLLGTVMGMLTTFNLMNRGDIRKVDLMAGGISEALITTQMGLIIAVPSLFLLMMLRVRRDRLSQFFEKLENDCFREIAS